jgi:hypothetical protein
VQLGLENKKKTIWAAVLGVLAILAVAYQFLPMLTGPSSPDSSAQAAAPVPRIAAHTGTRPGRKARSENLDPTLRLELLAPSEQTEYRGSGRNIFVSQAEPVIPPPISSGRTDQPNKPGDPITGYQIPRPGPAPPIPLQFYGFASRPGEPKRVFLKLGGDVWVAGEGDTVDLRYKVIRITSTSVDILDSVTSATQTIPLTQG